MEVAEEAIWQNVLICKIERNIAKLLAFCSTCLFYFMDEPPTT
jgi:hypothetical protein